MVEGTRAVVRSPLEIEHLVGLELLLNQQKSRKRQAQANDGSQPDAATVLC